MAVASLAVTIPLIAAAALAGAAHWFRRPLSEAVGIVAASASAVLCAILLARAIDSSPLVYWFGGWEPRDGIAIGISFTVDPIGAGLATFVALLMVFALVFSWRYLEAERAYYQVLMLVFGAAMVGFCLSGDLFNMFVFFELMSVAAYALAGYKIEQRAALEGSLAFGVTNSLGSFLILFGIGLIYGRTGALNLGQIGEALAAEPADGLVVVAFALLVTGFFVKAAVVPFHFWLADAYAVAPTPVCLLFAGAMSELGIYAVARIYFSSFADPMLPHTGGLRTVLVLAGLLTAVVGAVMCFRQDHLKRLLAFLTISHVGIFAAGLGALSDHAVGGVALYALADGCLKASLFACVGILQHRHAMVSERRLRGRGRELPVTGVVFCLGALAVAGMPVFGTFLGKALIDEALIAEGFGWALAVIALVTALTGGAVLRAAGRVFLGWGPPEEEKVGPADRETPREAPQERGRAPAPMLIPAILLLVAGLAAGSWFGFADAIGEAAARFTDHFAYASAVIDGHLVADPAAPPTPVPVWHDWLLAAASVCGALAIAAVALFYPRLPRLLPRRAALLERPLGALDRLHSGHVGDYVAWLTAGVAGFGAAFALAAPT
jgi:multicomponent Na+:H+ antiporter subunit D